MSDCYVGSPEDAQSLFVYSYQHLDDLSFVRRPENVFRETSEAKLSQYVEAVKEKLQSAGWEGDGELGIIWFPPFAGVGAEDTNGAYVWCVKQSNNGTSWLASHFPMSFKALLSQNP